MKTVIGGDGVDGGVGVWSLVDGDLGRRRKDTLGFRGILEAE
jgi:hypothetical protein